MLTQDFKDMLYAFGCGARGEKATYNYKININNIHELATKQGVWQTVYLALQDMPEAEKYRGSFLMAVSKNISRNNFVLKVADTLRESGIECCFLKGMAVSYLYKEPHCRISGDTDILINPSFEKKSMKILRSLGFDVDERGKHSHHYVARHTVGGIVEVHVKMYSDPTKDILFNDKLRYDEDLIDLEIADGYVIKTFSIDDNAVYLTAHYIKHFISKGVGVRQMMDLLLYLERYKDKINWDKYNGIFESLNYMRLIKTLYAIGNRYFGFCFDEAEYDLSERVLEDTQEGGVFGDAEALGEFYAVFTRERTTMDYNKYNMYMKKKHSAGFIRRLFPRPKVMTEQGYEFNSKFQLFFRYIQRIFDICLKMVNGKKKLKNSYTISPADEVSKKISDRIDMMKRFGII